MWINSTTMVTAKPQEAGEKSAEPKAAVEKPLIVERKGDRLIWRLQAESALQQEQGMYLTEPRLELFTEAGEAVPVRGREAWFEPLRKNIRFKGAVRVKFRDWQLKSETLQYVSSRDEAYVTDGFELKKPGITLKGKGLRVDRKSQRLTVEHNVWLEDRTGGALGGKP